MTFESALKNIVKNWSSYEHSIKGGHEAVWIVTSDIADSYEVDEEWIGVKGDGSIVWAYASGCSCWDGNYDTKVEKTIKALTLVHKHTPEDWQKKVIEFAKTGKLQSLERYDRYA